MDYFKVSKIDGNGFFADNYTGDLFTVEFTQDNGKSWTTMSMHLSFEGADKKMREYVAEHPGECALWEWSQPVIDPTAEPD